MKLLPYRAVDHMPFSARRTDVERSRGRALRVERGAAGLTALDYGDAVFRFQDTTGRLEEVTRRAPVLYLLLAGRVVDVPFGQLSEFVHGHDADAFDRAGFLVSPRFGLAFVPTEPDWVTALAAHCIDSWRALGA